jgi:hypothetical protein
MQELQNQMQAVRTICDDNHVESGLDKRIKFVLTTGKVKINFAL